MTNKEFNKQYKKVRKVFDIRGPEELVGRRFLGCDLDGISGDDLIDIMEELWGPCEKWEEDEI